MAGNLKSRLARIREIGLKPAASLVEDEGPAGGLGESGAEGEGKRPEASSPPSRLRASRGGRLPAVPRSSVARVPPACLSAWERRAPFVLGRILLQPDPLPDEVDAAPLLGRRALGALAAGPPPLRLPLRTESLRFFDLETTGLSGGTGTVAFLAAVGRRGPEGFEIVQLFLEDYPGEGDFIRAVLGELCGPGALPVTYNGHSFDLPLLATRCVMNGMERELERGIDLLHAARRLWRRVHGGARLGLLESAVLGRERVDDVPGALVPEAWLGYLRSGDHPLLPGVLSHNADDVLGLARLFARAAAVGSRPRDWLGSDRVDRAGLARILLALGREGEGEELLEAAAADGDEAAGLLLLRRARRSGRLSRARECLALLPPSFEAAIEEARLEERLGGDLEAARGAAEKALSRASGEVERAAAATRLRRLEARLGSRGSRHGARGSRPGA
jgi:uncharacterized protein YprB with RNaseH-like and TPR domain